MAPRSCARPSISPRHDTTSVRKTDHVHHHSGAVAVRRRDAPLPPSTCTPVGARRVDACPSVRPSEPADLLQTVIFSVSKRGCLFPLGHSPSALGWRFCSSSDENKDQRKDPQFPTGLSVKQWTFDRVKLSTVRGKNGIYVERKEPFALTSPLNICSLPLFFRQKIKCSEIWWVQPLTFIHPNKNLKQTL